MARTGNTISIQSGCRRPDYTKLKKESNKFNKLFHDALYYIHYEVNSKKLKAETLKYVKQQKLDFDHLKDMSDYYFECVGKPCLIINQGADVIPQWEESILPSLEQLNATGLRLKQEAEANAEADANEEVTPVKKQPTIQDRLRERAYEVCGEFEGWFDEFITSPTKFDLSKYKPYNHLLANEIKQGHARYILKFYEQNTTEISEVLKGKDDYLVEAYSEFTKPQLKKLLKLYELINAAAQMVVDSAAVSRKPRKKKAVSADKLVAKLKFMQSDSVNGLVSINPSDIIGAQELWVYNTKTRKLGKYIAADQLGLQVKGASITNFTSASVEKTLRKPAEQLKDFKKAGKVALRKYMDSIKSVDIKLKGRINENHILLKVQK